MDSNEFIEEMRRNSSLIKQVSNIPEIQKDKKYKESYEKKENSQDTDFKSSMDKATEIMKEKGNLIEQKAYIESLQFIKDHHLEEYEEEKITRSK